MPSFSTLFVLAIGALATFTAAAPLEVPATIGKVAVALGGVGSGVSDIVGGVTGERDENAPLSTILTDTKSRVSSIADSLNSAVTKNEVNTQVLMGAVNSIQTVLQDAVTKAKKLPAAGSNDSAFGIAQLLAGILIIVMDVLNLVINLTDELGLSFTTPLLIAVSKFIVELLGAVFSLVDGILLALVPLLGGVIPNMWSLDFTNVLDVLQVA